MERGLLLDVVIPQRAAILELFARKNQPLLVGCDALLLLDLALHVLDGVTWLHFQCEGFAGEGLDEDLHPRCIGMPGRRLSAKFTVAGPR